MEGLKTNLLQKIKKLLRTTDVMIPKTQKYHLKSKYFLDVRTDICMSILTTIPHFEIRFYPPAPTFLERAKNVLCE